MGDGGGRGRWRVSSAESDPLVCWKFIKEAYAISVSSTDMIIAF